MRVEAETSVHPECAKEQKIAAGAAPDAVRLSVGIEDAEDLIADLEQAMAGSGLTPNKTVFQ